MTDAKGNGIEERGLGSCGLLNRQLVLEVERFRGKASSRPGLLVVGKYDREENSGQSTEEEEKRTKEHHLPEKNLIRTFERL